MYLNGAALVGTFPVSAIAMSIGLNATLTSYHDRMDFGFVGNGVAMYDLPQLARHVRGGLRGTEGRRLEEAQGAETAHANA